MELYTSLVRLKQVMNGERLPPMVPLTSEARRYLDPAFTINGNGMGGLFEDERAGLRCPVRGCGQYHHHLAKHINAAHRDIGGADGVRKLLDIALRTPLSSAHARAQYAESARKSSHKFQKGHKAWKRTSVAKRTEAVRRATNTIGFQNLRDSCEAQVSHKIIDLHNKLGRTPTAEEAKREYGGNLIHRVVAVWGTWNNCVAQLGLEARRSPIQWSTDQVLEGLKAWYDEHGELPDSYTVRRADRVPFTASYPRILRVFGTESWPEAMRRAAALLNIYGGRYGLPPKQGAA